MTTKPLFIRTSLGWTRLPHRHVRCRQSQRKSKAVAVARRVSYRDAELLVPGSADATSIAAMRRAHQLLFVLE
jgi:hypothetical protein